MSSCLPEIYAQSYKYEQNLEIRCLCINSNTKVLEKEIEKRWDLSLLLLSLDINQLWLRVFYRARNWSQNTAHIIVFQPHPHLIEHQSVQNSPHGPNTDENSNSIWLQQMTDDPTFELFFFLFVFTSNLYFFLHIPLLVIFSCIFHLFLCIHLLPVFIYLPDHS